MKTCFECEKWNKEIGCSEDTRRMEIICLMRIYIWTYLAGVKQISPFIKKIEKELDEGEDWKKE